MAESTDATLADREAVRTDVAERLDPGGSIGRYVVIGRLGSGGMGVVFAVYDPELDRKVAVKLLHPHAAGSTASESGGRSRLQREAQALARLSHPNVVAVHDVGSHNGRIYVAMEFVEGTTLGAWARGGLRSWREILEVYEQAARGLAAAHASGLVHRDFKPDNAMLGGDGRVRVMDFGLARESAATREPAAAARSAALSLDLTEAGAVLGTPAYMAPEQHLGLRTDARTDQFSFCVALWEALFGERPFVGGSLAALADAVTSGRVHAPVDPRRVPSWLRAVVTRGLAAAPDDRHASMDALLLALARGRARVRRRRIALALAGVACAGVAVIGVRELDRRRTIAACEAEGARVEVVWNDDVRSSLAGAFTRSGAPNPEDLIARAQPWIDAAADGWRGATIDTCRRGRVDGTLAPAIASQASACLANRLDVLDETLRALQEADRRTAIRSVAMVARLPPADDCTDERQLSLEGWSDAEALSDETRAVRRELATVRALNLAGRYHESLDACTTALEHAEQIGWAPLVVAASIARSEALENDGAYAEAAKQAEHAFYLAGAHALDRAAAESASTLAFVEGCRLSRFDSGLRWAQIAEMMRARSGGPEDLLDATIAGEHAYVHSAHADYDEAIRLGERALAIRERILGPDHPEVGLSLLTLGRVQIDRGDYEGLLATQTRAIALWERAAGPDHPELIAPLGNAGAAYAGLGRVDEAIAAYERALAICERTQGPDHPDTAVTLHNLGDAHERVGRLDRAMEYYERVRAIRAANPTTVEYGQTLHHIANVELERGRIDDAARRYEEALAILERALGKDHPHVSYTVATLGEVELRRGRADRAIARLERALAIQTRGEVPADVSAFTRFALARALWDGGGDRVRAKELAREVVEARGDFAADAEAWLKGK